MNILDPISIIETAGYIGLFLVVFSETGILLGFFLPGDSLLFTAGFLASTGMIDLNVVIILSFIAAVIGDGVGYYLGKKYGPKIFTKSDSIFLDKRHIERTEKYFKKYGGETIILARFLPVIRTIAPVMAGVGRIGYKRFFAYNVFGGLIWTILLPSMGYYFGRIIPDADKIILPVVALIIVISLFPAVFTLFRDKDRRRGVVRKLSKIVKKK